LVSEYETKVRSEAPATKGVLESGYRKPEIGIGVGDEEEGRRGTADHIHRTAA
jgi:hypothetical protein